MATRFAEVKSASAELASEGNLTGSRFANVSGGAADLISPLGDDSTEAAQGRTREIIAVWLLGLVCAIVALAFTGYFLTLDGSDVATRFSNLKALLDVLVGPIITLLSSAIGFYFGSRTAQDKSSGGTSSGDSVKGAKS